MLEVFKYSENIFFSELYVYESENIHKILIIVMESCIMEFQPKMPVYTSCLTLISIHHSLIFVFI